MHLTTTPSRRRPRPPRPTAEWSRRSWPAELAAGSTVRVVTDDPLALPSARRVVDGELALVERTVGRGRSDGELGSLPAGRRTRTSPTLTSILAAALAAARETGGAVDPVVGHALETVPDAPGDDPGEGPGEDPGSERAQPGARHTPARWRGVELDAPARTVVVPRGVRLDPGPVARAWAADRCAHLVADLLGVGVLVSLGGDIATAGPEGSAGAGAWEVLVQDEPGGPAAVVAVPTGLAVATAGIESVGSAPGPLSWRSATVVAPDCVTATAWATAAVGGGPRGRAALETLGERGFPARLVTRDGAVRLLGGWPSDGEVDA